MTGSGVKTALVTGSSRGIGKAVALRLARDGVNVILHGAAASPALEETVREIASFGGACRVLTADLTDPDQAASLGKEAAGADILVLNASLQIPRPWAEITPEEARLQMQCNFFSSLTLLQVLVPGMQERRWGRIVTIGSVQEAKPHPKMLVYSASKAAQSNMTRSLSLQLAPFGITVNNVAPGVILTDRNKKALADADYAREVLDSIPLERFGVPEDCAGVVAFLCGDGAAYITGQSLYVDGGKSIL